MKETSNIHKGYIMTLGQYERLVESAELEYQKEYEQDIEILNDYINDALHILEQAKERLFFSKDILSYSMELQEFNDYILKELKDML